MGDLHFPPSVEARLRALHESLPIADSLAVRKEVPWPDRDVHWPEPRRDFYRPDPRPKNFYDHFSDFLQEKFGV